MSFKKISTILLITVLLVGALVLFFTNSGAVDVAEQSAEIIKDNVNNLGIKEETLNIWERLFK